MKKINLSNRKEILPLLVILTAVLAIRLIAFFYVQSTEPSRILMNDSAAYDNSAKALLYTGRFAVSPDRPQTPQTVRTPGYPAFIALVYLIFGEKHLPVIVIQILISLGTIIVTYLIARALWEARAALVTVLLLALDFNSLVNSERLMTETLFTFATVVAVMLGVKLILDKGNFKKEAFFFGFIFALATLIRPISYYLIFPLLAGFLVLKMIAGWPWKKITALLALIMIPWAILVGGWQLRNFLVTGSFEFSYIMGENLLLKAAGAVAEREGITYREANQRIYASFANAEEYPQAELNKLYLREALSIIRRYPLLYIKTATRYMMMVLTSPSSGYFMRYGYDGPIGDLIRLPIDKYIRKWLIDRPIQFVVFLFEIVHLLILNTAAIYSLRVMVVRKNKEVAAHIFIWGAVLYLLFASAQPETGERFRVAITPLLAIYAGGGLSYFFESLKNH